MAIDPRISLAYVPPQIDWAKVDPIARQQQILTLKALMDQQAIRKIQLEQMRQEAEYRDRLNKELTRTAPPAAQVSPEALRPIPPEAYLYEEPQLQRPAGPEGRGPGTAFAPAGMQTTPGTPFAPAGMGPTGSPLAGFDTNALIRAGGTYAFPLVKSINEVRESELKARQANLSFAKGVADAVASKLNGIVDDTSMKQILPSMAENKLISSDEARQYMGLGHDDPRTQAWVKSLKAQSLDYTQSIDAQIKQDKDAREQFADDRTRFAQQVQTLTDPKQFPALLSQYPPAVQKYYGSLAGITDLKKLQQAVTIASVKPEVGTTVAYPDPVQEGKAAVSAAQGLAAKQAELAFQNATNEPLIQAALRDPTGLFYANLPPEIQKQIGPELSKRGFKAFTRNATDAERRTLNFYERAKEAEDSILAVPQSTKENPTPKSLEQIITEKDTLGQLRFQYAPNFAQTPEGRQYWQALRQFTEARLRKESGAVISDNEYAQSQQTYFPVPGDDKDTLERKRKARQGLLESMKTEAGPAYTQRYGTSGPRYRTGERVVRNGETWEYIGPMQGDDWRDQKNWTKVTMQQ